eukprot:TRINITY_DN4136_c0_g1_i1.p1 TRINITY_DN4136_c0_g1~~TRINITY_DN4136_c0_g1_i1.p1  ORF type:complete len:491 (-),score=116.14 TRINITY_DN4136_c0_g1_i1:1149-2621(-)
MKRGKGAGEKDFNREDFLQFCVQKLKAESEQLFHEWEPILHECLQPEKGNSEEYMKTVFMILDDLEHDRVDYVNKTFPSELQAIVSKRVRQQAEEYGLPLEGIMLRWYRKKSDVSPRHKEAETIISQFYHVHRNPDTSVRTAAAWASLAHLQSSFKKHARAWHVSDHIGVAEYERLVAMDTLRKVLEGHTEPLISGFTTEAVSSGPSKNKLLSMVKRAREAIKTIRDSQVSKLEAAKKRRRVAESGTKERTRSTPSHEEDSGGGSMKSPPSAAHPKLELDVTSESAFPSSKLGRNVSGGMQTDTVKEVPYLPFKVMKCLIGHRRLDGDTAEYSKVKLKWDANYKRSTFQRQNVVSHADEEMERILSALPPGVNLEYMWKKDEDRPQCTVILTMEGFHMVIPELWISVPVEYPSTSCTWKFPLVELFRMNVHFSRVEKAMHENVRQILARKDGQQSDSLRVGEVTRLWMTGWLEELGRADSSISRTDHKTT